MKEIMTGEKGLNNYQSFDIALIYTGIITKETP